MPQAADLNDHMSIEKEKSKIKAEETVYILILDVADQGLYLWHHKLFLEVTPKHRIRKTI